MSNSEQSWEKFFPAIGHVVAALVIIVIVLVAAILSQSPAPTSSQLFTNSTSNVSSSLANVTNLAPDFTLSQIGLNGLTGRQVSLSSFYGEVIVLQFMVPWCPHCQHMAPVMEQLHRQYGAQVVVFISVAGPYRNASAADAAQFIQTYGTPWTYVYDPSGAVFTLYGVVATPTIFFIAKNGSVVTSQIGETTIDVLVSDLTEAMQQP